jgi:RND family efflux transporter MFP subunit
MTKITRWPRAVPLSALLFVVLGCAEEPPEKEVLRPVRSIVVGDPSVVSNRWWPGRAKATQEVDLGFEVTGQLAERSVKVGDNVKAGTVMARLDPRDYENALVRAKAERDRARAFFDRVAEAATTGAVARQDVDDARARFNQADAEVKIAQKAVDDTRIVAPFDGVVSRTFVDNFQNVLAKQPVIRFLDVSRIEMTVNIPEAFISLAPYVKDLRVRFDALPGHELRATIKEIGGEASQSTRTYPVTLILDPASQGADVKPGMAGEATAGRIEIPDDLRQERVEVPAAALFSPDGAAPEDTFVWVVDGQTKTVSRRKVTTGELTERGGTLVQGLEAGERIVTAGVSYLREGQKVRIQ